tara:strand:- start:585 stop:776 length:192 start_codon:yes stop_codon:yes gene_type:complete
MYSEPLFKASDFFDFKDPRLLMFLSFFTSLAPFPFENIIIFTISPLSTRFIGVPPTPNASSSG